jgi:hypothetical protein
LGFVAKLCNASNATLWQQPALCLTKSTVAFLLESIAELLTAGAKADTKNDRGKSPLE